MKKVKPESDPKPLGRPPEGGERKSVVPVRLTAKQRDIARALGDGVESVGIRKALDMAGKRIPK